MVSKYSPEEMRIAEQIAAHLDGGGTLLGASEKFGVPMGRIYVIYKQYKDILTERRRKNNKERKKLQDDLYNQILSFDNIREDGTAKCIFVAFPIKTKPRYISVIKRYINTLEEAGSLVFSPLTEGGVLDYDACVNVLKQCDEMHVFYAYKYEEVSFYIRIANSMKKPVYLSLNLTPKHPPPEDI